MTIFDILYEYRSLFWEGTKNTLLLIAIIYPIGLVLGVFLGVIRNSFTNGIGKLVKYVSVLIAATPILIILFWLHYPFQYMLGIVIHPFYTAVFAISLVCTFLISDIVSNALHEFPEQYLSTAKVCGLSKRNVILKIQLPLLVRQILPSVLNVLVAVLQMTLFASLISVNELFRAAQQINAEIYKPVEIYSAIGLFYMVISLSIFILAYYLKNKYTRNISER